MKLEHGKLDGNVRVVDELALYGMVTGDVTVAPNATLHLHGMACRNLTLEPESHVDLHGMVTGNVMNGGGHLRVYGTVNGQLTHHSGVTKIHSNAVIHGGASGPTQILEEE